MAGTSESTGANAVILISDDESETRATRHVAAATRSAASSIVGDSDSDSDVKLEETLNEVLSEPGHTSRSRKCKPKVTPPRTNKASSSKKKVRTSPITDFFSTPERPRKRHSSVGALANTGEALKPWTPSSAIKSSMNASLVFDMVTSLSTNDPGVAIATLRSIVVLGKEYPSDLLYTELIDRIQSHEAVAYTDAVAIYAALVFVFDKAASCSCAVTFPNHWEPLATALQEVSGEGVSAELVLASDKPQQDEAWRRNLLVVQFYVYCFQRDLNACRERYEKLEQSAWIFRTRLFSLLQSDASSTSSSARARVKARRSSVGKTRNNTLILQAITWALQLWKHVYDDDEAADGKKKQKQKKQKTSSTAASEEGTGLFRRQEGEQTCLAVLRLIEMLFMCTDQQGNTLQRIQAGLMELSRPTRVKFAQALQSPALRTQLATTIIGLSNKARSTETEWYECNTMGRVLLTRNPDTSDNVVATDGYSWSHFDSFLNMKPRNGITRLLQEIAQLQQDR